nr:14750_t:CDS:2 [Entrophospora candida]
MIENLNEQQTSKSINFSAFLEKDFNVKAWINDAVSSSVKDATTTVGKHSKEHEVQLLENNVTILIEKLQFLSQEISHRLGKTVEDVTKSMPRILSDLQVMQEDTKNLKVDITKVKNSVNNVETDTGKTLLEQLKSLDLVKSRMEESHAVLQEAENWSNLEADANNIFASNDYQKASSRLHEAEKSLIIFQNTPEYEHRHKLLSELKNQLETKINPQLVVALSEHDISSCQMFYAIFCQIGRKKEFCNYYYESRKEHFVKLWQNAAIIDVATMMNDTSKQKHQQNPPITTITTSSSNTFDSQNQSNSYKKFVEFLQEFYEELFMKLNKEYTWCGNVFPDTNEIIITLIESIFDSLEPSLSTRLLGLIEYYGEQCLPEIIDAFTLTENFVIFEPFVEYQHDFSEYEKNYLIDLFKKTILQSTEISGSVELAKVMSGNISKIFYMAENSVKRCMKLTHGFAAVGLINCLNYFFSFFIKEYHTLLDQLRTDFRLNDYHVKYHKHSKSSGHMNDYYYSEFDQDKLQEDWSNFQIGLRLLSTCRIATDKLKILEDNIKEKLVSMRPLIELDINNHDKFGWYEQQSVIIEKTTFTGTLSSLSLLQQSPLNSHQLNELLSGDIKTKQVLKTSVKSISTFTKSSQLLVFDSIFFPIVKHMINLPSMEIWNATAESSQISPFNIEIPIFSLSPSEYMTRIGEHLLTLPQQFEVFADDESLAFSIGSLPYSDEKSINTAAAVAEAATTTVTTASSIATKEGIIKEIDQKDETNNNNIQMEEEEFLTGEVTHTWITSIARGTMHAIFERILAIPQLSTHGIKQLLTDLGYLTNVLSALDISPTREVQKTVKVLEMDEDQLFKLLRLRSNSDDKIDEFIDAGDREILIKVAALRGVKLLDL